jgi:phenylalanyl-tRNA synthetase alpha chain
MQDEIARLSADIDAYQLDSEDAVETFRVTYLGRKAGAITDLFKQMGGLEPEERRTLGQHINTLKQRAEERIEEARSALEGPAGDAVPAIDLTLPGRTVPRGTIHPLTRTLNDIRDIFARFGFEMATGPEIEDDWHNFTALNFPPDHPARDMQDTFFIEAPDESGDSVLLRTHTSPVQIRVMKSEQPPIRVIVPGRVYRNESISYKSFCLFNQVEGLYVDEGVTFADLKQLLNMFARAVFGDDVRIRFRASYFPFTEPSAEVDVWWEKADHPDGGMWMEILGCGMVDPAVLDAVGIDSERYTGYAFGLGVDRMAMRRYGIDDIRILYENDLRFLRQF